MTSGVPPSIQQFVEEQLGPGATPGWPWTAGDILDSRWGWASPDGAPFRWLKIGIEERLSEPSRAFAGDAYFVGPAEAELTWHADALVSWRCLPSAREFGPLRLSRDEAVAALRKSIAVPTDGATEPVVRTARKLTTHLLEITWGRVAAGLSVHGDTVLAMLNATSGRLASYSRGPWSPLPSFDGPPMSEAEARRIAAARASAILPGAREGDRAQRILWNDGIPGYERVWSVWFDAEDPDAPAEPPDLTPPDEAVVEEGSAPPVPFRPRKILVVNVGDDGRVSVS